MTWSHPDGNHHARTLDAIRRDAGLLPLHEVEEILCPKCSGEGCDGCWLEGSMLIDTIPKRRAYKKLLMLKDG